MVERTLMKKWSKLVIPGYIGDILTGNFVMTELN